jgi:hypothetical protein
VVFDGSGKIRQRPCNNLPAQQEGGTMRGQEGGARGGNATTSFVVFRHTTLAIRGVVIYFAAMALCGVVVCHAATVIRGIVFCCTAIAIGGVVFHSLNPRGYTVLSSSAALWW